ncbi:uncharacterized protein isoform X1 [Danio rerio]|uniref:Uncharacterized protein LOC100136844 precursor n=4 Tax=Danio rerio TaxID=7955 RepID=R4GEF7_DANRE|nr:uncharacterized protein LOC100136844 precursor [Danio rerio]|eukprot:NP_001108035.2 uncharacterized protein LOC100136844 precursor [Danio rerio]
MFCLSFIISLLMIPGICSQKWEVRYSKTAICVLKGSTMRLSGSYKHPDGLTVTEIFWTVNIEKGKAINLLNNPNYTGRVDYFQIEEMFFLKLSNVRHEDEGMYCIRIETKVEKQQFLGFPGIELTVTDLRVETPAEVVEGDSPVLTCKSSCNLGSTIFIWYKNGKSFSESVRQNQLILQSVSSEDSGNYSCAVRDLKDLPSPALTLNIRYPPKSVSVSVSGSAVIESGDSVTLSCSSDSNPPAVNFTWFKENQSSAVGSGQSFSISSFNSSHSGQYYCEAENKYGSQRSESVSVTVKESGSFWISITAGIAASAFVFVFIVIIRKRVTRSEEQNHRGSQQQQQQKHSAVEPPEDPYMALDPNSRCSEYDTLDNLKRSCENTDDREDDGSTYYNIDQ